MSEDMREHQQLVPAKGKDESPGFIIPLGVAAVVLVAATLIFGSAGSDRTQVAENGASPAATQSARPESAIPPRGASEPAATPAPQKSNPAGTQ